MKNNQTNLTDKEIEIIHLLTKGQSRKTITSRLNISIRTIDTHLRNAHIKTNTSNMVELVHWGHKNLGVEE